MTSYFPFLNINICKEGFYSVETKRREENEREFKKNQT